MGQKKGAPVFFGCHAAVRFFTENPKPRSNIVSIAILSRGNKLIRKVGNSTPGGVRAWSTFLATQPEEVLLL